MTSVLGSFEAMRKIRGWLLSRDLNRIVSLATESGRTVYGVPSATRPAIHYSVFVDEDGALVCTCMDFAARQQPCKHIIEVLYRYHPGLAPPPPTGEELQRLAPSELYAGARRNERTPFPYSDGPAESTRRDRALTREPERIPSLLADLASVINARHPQHGAHRHTLPAGDKVLALVLRDYHKKSLRATPALLKPIAAAGQIAFRPCKSSLITYFQDANTLKYLQEAFSLSTSPFRIMEQDVIVDSSGISPFYFESWRAIKYGDHKSPVAKWFRIHIAIGRISHAVLGFALTPCTGEGSGDASNLSGLLDGVQMGGFDLRYVIADNAYLDRERVADVSARGAFLVGPLKQRNRDKRGNVAPWLVSIERFAMLYPDLYDETLRGRQPIECFFSVEKRHDNRLRAIGTSEERAAVERQEHDGLFLARVNEFVARMIRYNLTCINMQEHLRNRHIAFSKGSVFSHVREMIEDDISA